jgi:tetratricopeptide (TPR) repeat protein
MEILQHITDNSIYELNFNLYTGISILILFAVLAISNIIQFTNTFAQNSSIDVSNFISKGSNLPWLGNYTGAIKYYDKALAIDPTNEDALIHKVYALIDSGDFLRM